MEGNTLTIRELANEKSVLPKTPPYWESCGLLLNPGRMHS